MFPLKEAKCKAVNPSSVFAFTQLSIFSAETF